MRPFDAVAIGTSWGGLHALEVILRSLDGVLDVPVLIVQHRRADSDDTLARLLQKHTPMRVEEAADKEPLLRGSVYVAPADYHLLVEAPTTPGGPPTAALTVDAPVAYSRPSIDVLFDSVAASLGARSIGVLLTGANSDGAEGLRSIQHRGGVTIVQDPRTAESPAMPRAAVERGVASVVLSLEAIGPFLARLVGDRGRPVTRGVERLSRTE